MSERPQYVQLLGKFGCREKGDDEMSRSNRRLTTVQIPNTLRLVWSIPVSLTSTATMTETRPGDKERSSETLTSLRT
jgi:hypothetical protein